MISFSRRVMLGGIVSAAVLARPESARAVMPQTPRLVALGGPATEILYALGLGDSVVAIDISSQYPSEARAKPNVGYYRSVSAEGVLALSPTMIIATDGAGPPEAMDVLAAASVRMLSLHEVRRVDDIPARIRTIADATGVSERGSEVAKAVAADLKSLGEDIAKLAARRKTLILLGPPRAGAIMAGGSGSSGGFALELAGADNAASAITGWKPLTDEAAYGMEPEAIIVLQTSSPVSPDEVGQRPALADSPAVKQGRVVAADALSLIGCGPRAAHAAVAVARKIYPEAAFRDLPSRAWVGESIAGR